MQSYLAQDQNLDQYLFKKNYSPTTEQIQAVLQSNPEMFEAFLGEKTTINFHIHPTKKATMDRAHEFYDKLEQLAKTKNIPCPPRAINWYQFPEDNPNSLQVYHREEMPDGSFAKFGIFKDGGQVCNTWIPTQCYTAMIEHDRAVEAALTNKSSSTVTFNPFG